MKTEQIHTLVLGAGPSGLASAYALAKAGLKPVVLERDKVSGGLMRSLRHGDFILDIGRKELYNRLERVDEFWREILGNDYRLYDHRGGILYEGQIIEMSRQYRGVLRGMPVGTFLACGLELLWSRTNIGAKRPANLEEYWYQQRGKHLTRMANQGFQEKLVGKKWRDVPLPANFTNGEAPTLLQTAKAAVQRAFSKTETNTYKGEWRHPAKGTGQICEALERGIRERGGRVLHEAKVLNMATVDGKIASVTAEIGSETIEFRPEHLVSSAPAEFMQKLLLGEGPAGPAKPFKERRRVVILVYIFCNAEPKFPHFWLQVTDPNVHVGRIANFAKLNSDMVPKGKTCLCCEIYCFGDDNPLLKLTDKQVAEQTVDECARSNLIDRATVFDTKVVRFPGADASQNRHNWWSPQRQALLRELAKFKNLYSVNRTDLDIATLAGIEAAEAIIIGDRSKFDLHMDPMQIGVRSAPKPFEFKNPPGVEI